MLQQSFTHRNVHFCIFIGPDWGEMGDLKVQIIFIGSPRCSQTTRTHSFDLFCFVILFLYCEDRTFITFHLFMHMQIGCLTSSGSSLFIFSIGGLWIICSCFGIFLILLYCFSLFILLHSICLYPHLPHLVEEEAFLRFLRLVNVHLCGFSVPISGILFPFTFVCDFFSSFLYSPPSYLLLVFPSNRSWSSKFSRKLTVQPQHCCMASLWAELAFLQLIGQSETLLFHSLSYSALI